jgi:hypothetical protein
MLLLALLALVGGERVAVVVSDPGGRGDELAQAVTQRLRAEGWDAVAVAPPRGRIDLPREQDRLAKQVGATRVLALELRSARRTRQTTGGNVQPSYPPSVRVWRFDVSNLQQAMEQDVRADPSPTLPPSATHRPRFVQEEERAETRLMWHRVGESGFDIDRQLGTAAMTGWREDVPATETRESVTRESQLRQRLFAEVAGQAAELVEMK